MKTSPTNTTEDSEKHPERFLAEALLFGGSMAIRMEGARGQVELVNSTVLPTSGLDAVRPILEKAGGKVGDLVEGDDLFTYVELPGGWEKEFTDHSMWSTLVDDRGFERAMIFYKAASYDRAAQIQISRRFSIDAYGWSGSHPGQCRSKLIDKRDIENFETEVVTFDPQNPADQYEQTKCLETRVQGFLDEHYPNWQDPYAYWD